MQRNGLPLLSVFALLGLLAPAASQAAVTYYLSNGPNPNGDLAWQAAVGSFTELDLDNFADGQVVQNLTAGPTSITVGPGATGQQIFFGNYAGGGGVYGTVFGGALETADSNNMLTNMTFDFSPPVSGFGLWIFDDNSTLPGSFTMTVTESGGGLSTSGVLDANPAQTNHIVDGFVGAQSTVGITSVIINEVPLAGFEVDHLQVATSGQQVPATDWRGLVLLVLVLMGTMPFLVRRTVPRRPVQ